MTQILQKIIQIGLQHRIQKVVLFGSRARGDYHEKSDFDIAYISPTLTIDVKNTIKEQVDEIDTLYKFDIVFLSNLNGTDLLTENILHDGVILMNKFKIKLDNLKNACARLEESISDYEILQNLSVRDGAIQRFEFTTELAWKTIREYLLSENVINVNTPKSVMREAFANNIIADEKSWISILNDRNATSHIYSEEEADEIFERICTVYVHLFKEVIEVLEGMN